MHILVVVDNSTFTGDAWQTANHDNNGQTVTQFGSSGLLAGPFNGPHHGPGGAVLTVPNLQLPVNQPFFLRLGIAAQTVAQGNGEATGGAFATADFSHTLSFPTVGPVFDLPRGYTVNSVDGLIVNNQFVGGASSVNPPVANAGLDQVVTEEQLVTLDGSGSMVPSALPLTYTWSKWLEILSRSI